MTRDTEIGGPLWIALLTTASVLATALLACRIPYAALAVLAAMTMRRRDGIAMLLTVWATSQIIGFLVLHYPHDPKTLGWGAAMGVAAIVAFGAASVVTGGVRGLVPRAVVGLLAAYVAFKGVIAAAGLVLGGAATLIAPALLARQLPREAAFLLGLLIAYHLLTRLGVPPADRRRLQAAQVLRRVADGPAIVACSSCRHADGSRTDAGGLSGGARLIERLRAVQAEGGDYAAIAVQEMPCLFACQDHCTVHLRAPDRIGYILGRFTADADAARAILDFAVAQAASPEGQVPYRSWPEGVKGHFITRMPPAGFVAE